MDVVMSFNSELAALYECTPPISKAKMTSITKAAIKAIKYYKHVVQSVEKFIQKCKTEYKIPGLYVIDSIVRQSRHQFGYDKDVFAPRFGKNILVTFYYLFKCPSEAKSRVIRVLNLWQKNNVFEQDIIQPIFDLADPNHQLSRDICNNIHQKAARAKHHGQPGAHTSSQQPPQNQTPQHQLTPQTPQTPQQAHCTSSATTPSSVNTSMGSSVSNQMNNPVVTGIDPNLIQQIQQILMKTEESAVASSVAALSNLSTNSTSFMHHSLPILGIQNQPTTFPIHQPPPTIVHPQLTQPTVLDPQPNLPGLSTSGNIGDYDERTVPFVDTSLPPPGYLQNFSHSQPPHIPNTIMSNISQKPPSPKEEGEHSEESDEDKENHKEEIIQIDDHSRSPPYNPSRRGRKRSRSTSRSRSRHHRSRSRGRRSRSRDRRYRDRTRSRRDMDKDQEREKERERKRKGLPLIKAEHITVCSTTLWVGHLSKLVHQEELSDTFGEYGDVVSINLIPPRGCAFICMNRRQDAARALQKLRNYKMLNKVITIAWAPGKGVKGKEFKDYWEVDTGCSYVPYSKLTSMDTADLDALEEGGMMDEDSVPTWLKVKLNGRLEGNQKEAQVKPPQIIDAITVLPPPISNPLGMVPTLGADMITPIVPFALPTIPPPRIQPGALPPLGPPLIPPPMGLPPLGHPPLGHPVHATVPPHMSMPPTTHHFEPPPMLNQTGSSSAHDSDSMDVEMEDVQKTESNVQSSSHQSTENKNEAGDISENNFSRVQSENIHIPLQAFGLRGIGIGGFLGPPPPIIAGRPGIVRDCPKVFSPMDVSINNRFLRPPPPLRCPIPDRPPGIIEEGGWTEDDNERHKYRNKKESWKPDDNGMYDNDGGGRRMEASKQAEQEEVPHRYRDRCRMRETDELSRNRESKYRCYDRDENNRDRGRDRDTDRSRDRMRDRYDREQAYDRGRYKEDRRDQWSGKDRWEERRSSHNDRKLWNEDRWNHSFKETVEEDNNNGWMNSEAYAVQQRLVEETPKRHQESILSEEQGVPQNDSGDEKTSSIDKPVHSTEHNQKQLRERDATRVSRWERKVDDVQSKQSDVPELANDHLTDVTSITTETPTECIAIATPELCHNTTELHDDKSVSTTEAYNPFETDNSNSPNKSTNLNIASNPVKEYNCDVQNSICNRLHDEEEEKVMDAYSPSLNNSKEREGLEVDSSAIDDNFESFIGPEDTTDFSLEDPNNTKSEDIFYECNEKCDSPTILINKIVNEAENKNCKENEKLNCETNNKYSDINDSTIEIGSSSSQNDVDLPNSESFMAALPNKGLPDCEHLQQVEVSEVYDKESLDIAPEENCIAASILREEHDHSALELLQESDLKSELENSVDGNIQIN